MLIVVLSSFTTVYSNLGFYRHSPPSSRLGTGTMRHYTVMQCVVLQ